VVVRTMAVPVWPAVLVVEALAGAPVATNNRVLALQTKAMQVPLV